MAERVSVDFGPPEWDLMRIRAGEPESFKVEVEPTYFASVAGAEWRASVRRFSNDEAVALELDITLVADGLFITVPATTRDVLGSERVWHGVWDLQITHNGVPDTLAAGAIEIEGDVTR